MTPSTRPFLVLAALAGLLLTAGAWRAQAQPVTTPDEQARRLLEDGRAYQREGKTKQALDNFNTIVTGFPDTDSVDDALLEIGRHHFEAERDVEKARAAFDKVAKQYPQSDGAPGAYYWLGWLTLERAASQAELDDALAQFARVQRLYPRSAWVPRALHAEGLVLRKAGKLEEAVYAQRRVALEHPASDAAPAAQFEIGHCLALLGRPELAMEEFQRVRNRFPHAEWSERALDRITGLYRLHGGARPAFRLDSGFSVGAGDVLKDVRALLMTPARTLWIASDKLDSVVPFDAAGKIGSSVQSQDVRCLSLSPRGEIVITARLAVRIGIGLASLRALTIPSDKPGEPQPLDRLTAALVTPGGSLLVADEKRKHVYRFDSAFEYRGVFGDGGERKVTRLLLDAEGTVLALDADARAVLFFDERGKLLRRIELRGQGYDLRKPADVAVDPAGNLYVADENDGVVVLTRQGRLLARVGGAELKKATALTLDPSGAVLVYDDREARVWRYN